MRLRPVLVRPRYDGNAGAVVRVTANFGIRELVIVDPACDLAGSDFRRMSMGAERLVTITVAPTLAEAVAGVDAVVATTSGRERDPRHLLAPEEVGERLRAGGAESAAVLFGGERGGLTQQELQRSHMLLTIPANPDFPTLNLVQAVAITLAALVKRDLPAPRPEDPLDCVAPDAEFDAALAQLDRVLLETGFLDRANPGRVASQIRRLLGRAVPSRREVAIVRGLAAHLEYLAKRKPPER